MNKGKQFKINNLLNKFKLKKSARIQAWIRNYYKNKLNENNKRIHLKLLNQKWL